MMENMNEEGLTKITDLLGKVTVVKLLEEVVGTSLSLPSSNYPMRERRAHFNLANIFENPRKTENTYSQMKSSVMWQIT